LTDADITTGCPAAPLYGPPALIVVDGPPTDKLVRSDPDEPVLVSTRSDTCPDMGEEKGRLTTCPEALLPSGKTQNQLSVELSG
jgi:hypothetical protein